MNASSASSPPALELRSIVKEYEQNRVLKGVSLTVRQGEIHALVGENGAGKSTLMNILFGMPVIWETGGYEGEVLLAAPRADSNRRPRRWKRGIGMVHQEFMLLPGFRVAENIKAEPRAHAPQIPPRGVLGNKPRVPGREAHARRRPARARRGGTGHRRVDPGRGPPRRTHAVHRDRARVDKERLKLLIFDEPTAVLTEGDAEKLLDIMRGLARRGTRFLFITHRLDEVLAVADRITVLRDGEVVGTLIRRPRRSSGSRS